MRCVSTAGKFEYSAVRICHRLHDFGGMYREVYVQVRNKTHLADVFVKPQIHPLQVTTEITVQNISDGITLQQEIRKKGYYRKA